MNKVAILSLMLGSVGGIGLMSEIAIDATSQRSIATLNTNKVLDIDFNNNQIKNTVNNKTYISANGNHQLVNSVKGKGFQPNGDYIVIPNADLKISDQEYVTVSMMYKYGGTDDVQMLMAFGAYDLYLYEGKLGFNTSKGDIYGVQYTPPTDSYINITATFHKSDITKNKLYIDGVEQTLSHQLDGRPEIPTNAFSDNLYIANWFNVNEPYPISDKSIIDEFKIFKGAITNVQAEKLAMAHRIPELTIRKEGSHAQANWATEILESDLIYNYDFEDGEFIPYFNHASNINGDTTGGQRTTTDIAYSGLQSIYMAKSTGKLGNWYQFPQTFSDKNIMKFDKLYIPNGTRLSVSFRTKNNDSGNYIQALGDGGWADKIKTHNINIVQDTPAGSNTLVVDSISGIGLGSYITSDRAEKYGNEYSRQIRGIIDNGNGTYTLELNDKFVYAQKAGEKVHYRDWRGAWSFPGVNHSNTDWQLHNMNTSVSNYSDYDVATRGGTFYITSTNNNFNYLDDLKFGYATKVKLYRDNNLVYEGYEAQYNDKSATDKAKPVMSNIEVNSAYEDDNRKITMSFDKVIDDGTKYNYAIKSVGASGKETFLTENKPITITSGLKGYSYVIDKNPSTVPSNTINLSENETSITHNINRDDTDTYYLHIKAIDNEGNIGDTKHILIDNPILTAQAKPSEDKIRLDWTMNDIKNKTFKVYQKKEGNDDFQSISATNFEKVDKVKVLMVYPEGTCDMGDSRQPMISYIDKNGNTVEIPLSASLKKWMEEPKEGYPLGYGKGIIDVDIVSINEFNANPANYLKDSSGGYKYNVFVLGVADCNGAREALEETASNEIGLFIEAGRGVFFGHDTVYDDVRITNANIAKKYMNMTVDSSRAESYSDTNVEIVRKGLLINYPYEIGDIGTVLKTPISHTSHQIPNSITDNWIVYANGNKNSKRNFYLTTYNNMAMSQTGHSTGQATEDEQKILANTLFYLNQLATDNYLDDNSGQDVKAPNKPTLNNQVINNDDTLTFSLNSVVDNGSTYEYYVESKDKDNNITLSNKVSETITSGLKGYSFVVDSNANTIPDNTIDTTSTNITADITSNNLYLHVKAIDNVGNASETLHVQVSDTTNPTMTITGNPTSWTNKDVTLNVTANDTGSGVKHIVLPNGTIVKGSTAGYTVSANGGYTFQVVDKMGNTTSQTVVVDKIDKSINTLTGTNQTMSMINVSNSTRRMTFTFNPVKDSQSGLKGYSYVIDKNPSTIPDNNINTTSTTVTKDITDTGVYYLHIKAIDNVGNTSNVVHHKVDIPNLTAQVNSKDNFIKLNWTLNDYNNKTYKVYQKKEGSNDFQTIGATNFDKTEQVKVLNVYPAGYGSDVLNPITPITFTTWDGETVTTDLSGSLKKWMEEPNAEHPKGYGQGLIDVTPVTFADFNANPSNYLTKDSEGKWNYDVVFVGAYDCNGSCALQGRFTTNTTNYMTSYVDEGYGFLLGHDFNSLKERLKSGETSGVGALSSDLIKINKKGIMTSYPWSLGEVGDVLNIPYAHNNGDMVDADVWFKYDENTNPDHCIKWCNIEVQTERSTNNHYLATKNNLGMIQTGHSKGNATVDEMKILANTLFYLKQLSTDNYLDDYSGADVSAPDMPRFTNHTFTDDGHINLTFNGVEDKGSEYSYYVESQTRDNDSLTLSNVVSETITSGIKGYSFVVDNKSTTIPDNDVELTSVETIKVKTKPNEELYVHIKAVDNQGNASETYHYKITDATKPVLSFEIAPSSWTNGNVVITAIATDTGSGVKHIVLPNGNIVKGSTGSYTVDRNGIYYFRAMDYMGNEVVSSVTITNIDKKKPTVTINNNQNWTNEDVEVTITSDDE